MALEPKTTLGPYQVTAKIGEGGMGEVYRARDTNLDRDVALKVLPQAFTEDPDRLARFEREAKVLASLNHPDIAGIYGLEESGDTRALVLELVEGPTLADRIAKGPIPLDEALPIATQIAEALEAAHEAGVIHRDLKPANIKVRDDGTVKVLDFGLAKALDPSPEGDPSQSPTLTAAATQMGVIMGTAAYMSPEQARGKPVDKRADIWAFGCVLYEMLTGAQPFAGNDVSQTLARVIERETDLGVLPTGVPDPIRRLLRRCLAKERKRRLSDIGDARLELEEVIAGSSPAVPPSSTHQQAAPKTTVPLVASVSMAAVTALVTALVVWSVMRQPDSPTDMMRLTMEVSQLAPTRRSAFALSPDGRNFVYRGAGASTDRRQLYLRRLDQLNVVPLPGTESADTDMPFFSPDGAWVGFATESATRLQRVSVFGGVPETLARLSANMSGASWGADEGIIVGMTTGGLLRVPAVGGEPEPLTSPASESGDVSHRWPSIIPGHHAVLFAVVGRDMATSQLAALALPTGEVTRLALAGTTPRYVQTGHLVYVTGDGSVRAVPFDADQLAVTGNPVTLPERVRVNDFGAASISISDAGRLVYMAGADDSDVSPSVVWVDRHGDMTPFIEGMDVRGQQPRLSPSADRVALWVDFDIHVWDLTRASRFGWVEDGIDVFPTWTPDGTAVTFASDRSGSYNVYSRRADPSGTAELLMDAAEILVPDAWSPDGALLVYYEINPDTERDLWVRASDGMASPFLVTDFNEQAARVSPDGRWVAYVSDQSGQNRIYVQPFPDGGRVTPISTGPGTEPVWSRDGRALFYRDGNQLMEVALESGPQLTVERPRLLFEGPYLLDPLGVGVPNYDVAPDAQRFLMVTATGDVAPGAIIVVDHWHRELNRPAPVN